MKLCKRLIRRKIIVYILGGIFVKKGIATIIIVTVCSITIIIGGVMIIRPHSTKAVLKPEIQKSVNSYKYDFGSGTKQAGYIKVSASTAYSKKTGYGFNTPGSMQNVAASGSGTESDAVQFLTSGTKGTNTFNVDLPKGLYEVKVTLGNTSRASVVAEGIYQIMDMTGNCATDKFQIPVTDGQCARGFYKDGQFEAIMKYIKSGDYFILQLGINDTNPKNNETEAQFKEIIEDMVKQVKAKGATVVLSTPQGRATDFNSDNVHTCTNRWYRNSILAISKEENVPLVDLNVLSSAYFTSIGKDATLSLYMKGDTLHPNRAGAAELARLVAEELKRQGLSGF